MTMRPIPGTFSQRTKVVTALSIRPTRLGGAGFNSKMHLTVQTIHRVKRSRVACCLPRQTLRIESQ